VDLQAAKDAGEENEAAAKLLADRHDHMCTLVVQAESRIDGLEGLHTATKEAGKKLTHVKELQKVGAVQELELDRDKLMSEVKYMREVTNVLKFAVNMAEQSLKELQPHVVEKLVQSRSKQLKLLAKQRAAAAQDLESRSKDTASMNGALMETFAKKVLMRLLVIFSSWSRHVVSLYFSFHSLTSNYHPLPHTHTRARTHTHTHTRPLRRLLKWMQTSTGALRSSKTC
jgi:hypothetical protein